MPTNTELAGRRATAVAQGVAGKGIYVARARNAELWDVEGRRFLDFTAGIAVNNTGHGHSKVMGAVARQASRVAAMIIEPVQGKGGFNVTPPEFLQSLRRICDDNGIVLIADEVQGGVARTGRMLSIEHSGVRPDIVTLAKGIAGGFPLPAVVGKARLMNAPHPGGLGGTYAGNPLAVAAANAVLDVIVEERLCARAEVEERLCARAESVGQTIRNRLDALADRCELVGDVRGLGAMVAFELVLDRDTKAADSAVAARMAAEAEARGLVILSCGTRGNVIRLLPPLTIPEEHLAEGLDILETAVVAASAPQQSAA